MARNLYILCDQSGEPRSWSQLAAGGETLASGDGCPPAALHAAARLVMLLPGSEVPVYRTELPVRQRHEAQRAVAWALEEQLAADPETLQFGLPQKLVPGPLTVAVLAHATLEAWRARWAALGLEPALATSELELLPQAPSRPWLWLDDGLARLALPDGRRLAVDSDLLPMLAEELDLREGELIDARGGDAALPESLAGWTVRRFAPDAAWRSLLPGFDVQRCCNLLEGRHARQRPGRGWKAWRPVGIAALAVAALALVWVAVDLRQLDRERRALEAEIERLFFVALPEATQFSAPRERVAQELERLRGGAGSGLFVLLRRVAPILSGMPSIQLDALSWREGQLELAVVGPDLRSLDALREALASLPGQRVELLSVRPRDDGRSEGRLRLAGAGA